MEDTTVFEKIDLYEKEIELILKEVYDALLEKGYNPENQIIGYLMSGDPGYISSHKDARVKITKYSRSEILNAILKVYLK